MRSSGAYVADVLAERLAGREVQCVVLKLDQYDRRVARCEVEGEGLSEWLVASGAGNGVPALLRPYQWSAATAVLAAVILACQDHRAAAGRVWLLLALLVMTQAAWPPASPLLSDR